MRKVKTQKKTVSGGIIKKLNAEVADGRRSGLIVGREWAQKEGSLSDIQSIATGEEVFEGGHGSVIPFLCCTYEKFSLQGLTRIALDELNLGSETQPSPAEYGFTDGFIEAVNKVWMELKK